MKGIIHYKFVCSKRLNACVKWKGKYFEDYLFYRISRYLNNSRRIFTEPFENDYLNLTAHNLIT
jgi:hypothetical protein